MVRTTSSIDACLSVRTVTTPRSLDAMKFALTAALAFFSSGIVSAQVHAGGLHRCTDAAGNVTFSDSGCPSDTQASQQIPYRQSLSPSVPSDNYWSVENQARRLDERKEAERLARENRRLAEEQIEAQRQATEREERQRQFDSQSPPSQPVMTFEQARAAALKDAGYHRYNGLNVLQQERVDKQMQKYNYLPPASPQQSQGAMNGQNAQDQLLINGVPATPVGGGNYIDNTTGRFLQGAAGGVIDTTTGRFIPTH
jgi:hypothetical protein